MRLSDLLESRFRARLNRFLIEVELTGKVVQSYLPNPGRLKELLTPAAVVYLRVRASQGRKTSYDAVAVRSGSIVVSIDSRLPNKAVYGLLREGRLKEFLPYSSVTPEPTLGESRLDFLLRNGDDRYVEVKSCTLVLDGVAKFPDAPTERGRRHLGELIDAVRTGSRADVIFVVQRPDARLFAPNDDTDPAFGDTLREAHASGVGVHAFRTTFDGRNLVNFEPIQTSLGSG